MHLQSDDEIMGPVGRETSLSEPASAGCECYGLNDPSVMQDVQANDIVEVKVCPVEQQSISQDLRLPLTYEHAAKAPTRKVPSIAVVVPPVPDAWKDVPRIDQLDEDVTSLAVRELDKSKGSKMSSRGRPRGSRNRKSLRRERRLATLAKTRSLDPDGL